MKKKSVLKSSILTLIKYHAEKNEQEFRNEAYKISNYFNRNKEYQLSEYIMALLSDYNTFSPQEEITQEDITQDNIFAALNAIKTIGGKPQGEKKLLKTKKN